MLIWYRTEPIDSIKTIQIGKSYIWLKIQKDIVSTDRHIFLCATYLPPAESPYYNEDTFYILQDEICHFQTKGNVLICGDLNARTGNEPDFVNTQGDKLLQTPAPLCPHITSEIIMTTSQTKVGKAYYSSVSHWACI